MKQKLLVALLIFSMVFNAGIVSASNSLAKSVLSWGIEEIFIKDAPRDFEIEMEKNVKVSKVPERKFLDEDSREFIKNNNIRFIIEKDDKTFSFGNGQKKYAVAIFYEDISIITSGDSVFNCLKANQLLKNYDKDISSLIKDLKDSFDEVSINKNEKMEYPLVIDSVTGDDDKDKDKPPVVDPNEDNNEDEDKPPVVDPNEDNNENEDKPPVVDPNEDNNEDEDKPPVVDPNEDNNEDEDKPPVVDPDVDNNEDEDKPPVVDPDVDNNEDEDKPPVVDPDEDNNEDEDKPPVVDPNEDNNEDEDKPPVVDPDEELTGPDTIKNLSKYNELIKNGLTEKEAELAVMINEYRASLGLEELPISKSLTDVARIHVKDTNENHPQLQKDDRGIQGNLHSWSKSEKWTGGAYTPDHKHAEIMWNKPKELTNYEGYGFEVSTGYMVDPNNVDEDLPELSPKDALDSWKSSPGHNKVITTEGSWKNLNTFGVGIDESFSHVWFGEEEDPAGYYDDNPATETRENIEIIENEVQEEAPVMDTEPEMEIEEVTEETSAIEDSNTMVEENIDSVENIQE